MTNFFHPSLFFLLFLDPGSGMGKNQDPGSGINIPDPPHCHFSFANKDQIRIGLFSAFAKKVRG
jgi:hypothetical protein